MSKTWKEVREKPLRVLSRFLTEYYGERCPDYVEACPCCWGWEIYDELERLVTLND